MRIVITENQLGKVINEMSLSLKQGTPHTFDKYDINKVGTGEGSQWFGWGLYFTDVDDIAQNYAKDIAKSKNDEIKRKNYVFLKGVKIGGDSYTRYGQRQFTIDEHSFIEAVYPEYHKPNNEEKIPYVMIFGFLNNYCMELERYCELWVKDNIQNNWDYYIRIDYNIESTLKSFGNRRHEDDTDEDIELYKNLFIAWVDKYIRPLKPTDFTIKTDDQLKTSNVYDVTIHKGKTPEQYDYISWYDNLTDIQKRKIIDGFKREKVKNRIFYIADPGEDSFKQPKFFHSNKDAKDYDKRQTMNVFGMNLNKHDIIKSNFNVKEDLNKTVQEFYKQLCGLFGSDKEASLFLLRCGIDGIKYPTGSIAGGSSKDKGFNYVVFDPNAITIEKRNEIPLNEEKMSDITLYHGTPFEHKFNKMGNLSNGSFFSLDKSTSRDYGKYIFEVKLSPELKLFDTNNPEDCRLLINSVDSIHNDFKEKDDEEYWVTTPEQIYLNDSNWIIIEDNPAVKEWLEKNYDGVWLYEGSRNLLLFKPVNTKIISTKLIEVNENRKSGYVKSK